MLYKKHAISENAHSELLKCFILLIIIIIIVILLFKFRCNRHLCHLCWIFFACKNLPHTKNKKETKIVKVAAEKNPKSSSMHFKCSVNASVKTITF